MDFLYASTTIIWGNGAKTSFWDSPWFFGRKPWDIAPLIYDASTRKNWKVREALDANAWILKINRNTVISVAHICQFFTLWMLMHDLHLGTQTNDDIICKHANNGIYSAAIASKAQFLGLTLSSMDFMIWKAWDPPKIKFFAWFAIQDRIWTADRLERRGWENCRLCPP
uniref:Reverse transcriptase zinc-binding domain-containing protein n=1 Tax=Triticum urartu TaxID=4572 RepID=A0A8R7TRE4_TRIUA